MTDRRGCYRTGKAPIAQAKRASTADLAASTLPSSMYGKCCQPNGKAIDLRWVPLFMKLKLVQTVPKWQTPPQVMDSKTTTEAISPFVDVKSCVSLPRVALHALSVDYTADMIVRGFVIELKTAKFRRRSEARAEKPSSVKALAIWDDLSVPAKNSTHRRSWGTSKSIARLAIIAWMTSSTRTHGISSFVKPKTSRNSCVDKVASMAKSRPTWINAMAVGR